MLENRDPLALTRIDRFAALVREFLPTMRRLTPHLSEDELRDAASRMAEYRIADEDGFPRGTR
jgi:hypothetical protein